MAIRDERTKVTLDEGKMRLIYTKGVDTEPIFLTCKTMGTLMLSMQDMFDLAVLMDEYMHDWNKCKDEQLASIDGDIPPTASEEKEE